MERRFAMSGFYDNESEHGSATTCATPPASVISGRSSRSTNSFGTALTTPRPDHSFNPQGIENTFAWQRPSSTTQDTSSVQGGARLVGGAFVHEPDVYSVYQPAPHLRIEGLDSMNYQVHQSHTPPSSNPTFPQSNFIHTPALHNMSSEPLFEDSRRSKETIRQDNAYDACDEGDDDISSPGGLRAEVHRLKADVENLRRASSTGRSTPGHGSVYRTSGRSPSPSPAAKKNRTVKRKSAEENKFLDDVRKHLTHMMGGDMFAVDRRPSEADLLVFTQKWGNKQAHEFIACCDADKFKIVVGAKPRNPWNESASQIFAHDFLRASGAPVNASNVKKLKTAFFNRLRAVVADHNKRAKGGAAFRIHRTAERRLQRKRVVRLFLDVSLTPAEAANVKLFDRRRRIVTALEMLRPHLQMLDNLGVDGMSSDESEGEDANETACIVRIPRWRSKALSDWLHVIDRIYILSRRKAGNRRGSLPHLRIYKDGSFSLKDKFVSGLPKNAYDPEWLSKAQDVYEKDEEYLFKHENMLFLTSGSLEMLSGLD
ncbi:hypothetical protein GALMADRAFT_147736 [Galerina marginata CBS 339.88]|uniref:Uncharacterized protein n=1 Tax=Galerina marginata (strain CBS 339.88) TaxID=685588 RepID=A0A067SG15_GALM3|nr:hypothetical protein GALMADRAFT_147736 [Galerina marginata CBS 339.88]